VSTSDQGSSLNLTAKQLLLQKWIAGKSEKKQTVPTGSRSTHAPLSFSQQRLWFLDRLVPGSTAYNVAFGASIAGVLDVYSAHRAFNEIIRRHEALRTTFQSQDGVPTQVIHDPFSIDLQVTDIRGVSPSGRDAHVERIAREQMETPFALSCLPLLRIILLRVGEEEHVVIGTAHHIVFDGWSASLFFKEFIECYRAFSEGKEPLLPRLLVQYADFAEWQTNWLSGERLNAQLAFWKKQMSGELPMLQLPIDKARPSVYSFKGASLSFAFNPKLLEPARQLCRQSDATTFMLVLGALGVWLHRYSGQTDILIGCPIANRQYRELEEVIGCFANTLVMRVALAGDPDFHCALQRVREATLNAYANQDLPFEKLVQELHPDRDMSRNPLFQVMLNFDTVRGPKILQLPGLTIAPLDLHGSTSKFDLWLTIAELPDALNTLLEYNTDLFTRDMAQRMAGHLARLLEQVVANPEIPISSISLLTSEEYQQVTTGWNNTRANYDLEYALHRLFELQVEKTPMALACIFESKQLTYDELNQRSNRVAFYLRQRLFPGSVVGIMVQRSLEMVVGLLGILKSGCAYLPLDPEYPVDRLRFMLEDSMVSVVLVQSGADARFGEFKVDWLPLERVSLDGDLSQENLLLQVLPDDLAYAIYTSGSTGKPKAGMNTHRGICNRLLWMQDAYSLGPNDRVLQKTPFSFDVSVWEFFWPLLAGAAIVMARPGGHKDPEYLAQIIQYEKITTLHFVPSMLQPFLEWPGVEECASLRRVICSGEVLPPEFVKRFMALFPAVPLYNLYGPTEAAVDVTAWDCKQEIGRASIPIGRPIANTQIYVMDNRQMPVPTGVAGELYIGGVGVGRGYLNRPGLTAEKFVPDLFSHEGGARLYKTGDLVRWLPGGVLEFIDRVDSQVKVRGYRIELGEIEVRLRESSAVKDAVVMARADQTTAKQLVAYVIAAASADSFGRELRADHVQQWRSVFDRTYGETGAERQSDCRRNFVGWNSSYTGNPIDADEMQEWLDHTIDRILQFKPARILELGCGVGLLLLALAPRCERYVGTDISDQGLQYIRDMIESKPEYRGVELRRQPADDAIEGARGAFDVVILNSVVQYFPDRDYLLRVLATAAGMLKDGGRIFIGDVRHLGLLKPFHLSVEMFRAKGSFSADMLRQRVLARVEQEQELAVDPAFFFSLPSRMNNVTRVDVFLRRGKNSNEMTRFRYDAVLEIEGSRREAVPHAWDNWKQNELQWDRWSKSFLNDKPPLLCLTGIPNGRVARELHLAEMLVNAGQEVDALHVDSLHVGDLQKSASEQASEGIDPELFWDLGREAGYKTRVGLRPGDAPGTFSVIMEQLEQKEVSEESHVAWFDGSLIASGFESTNRPVREKMLQSLVFKLRSHLRVKLPEFMVPSQFVFLETLPVNANGKLDREALPLPGYDRFVSGAFVPPTSPLQETLVATWKEVLGVEQIGTADNFFDLGGDSIRALRAIAAIQKAGIDLSAQDLFKHQTIADLEVIIQERQMNGNRTSNPFDDRKASFFSNSNNDGSWDFADTKKDFPLANLNFLELQAYLGEDADRADIDIRSEIEDVFPLGALAQEMLVQHIAGGDPAINLVQRVDFFDQELDVGLYDRALQLLADRNPILRTSFLWKGLRHPLQIVHRNARIPFFYEDWRGGAESEIQSKLDHYLAKDSLLGLDLSRPPQLRVFLARSASNAFYTILSFNYMCMEGWSLALLTAEHMELYTALQRNLPPPEEARAAYKDYIAWLIQLDRTEAKSFWMKELSVVEMPTPFIKNIPGNVQTPGTEFRRIVRALSGQVTQDVRELSRSRRLTESVIFQAVWALLVSRYSKKEDVVLGIAVTGRSAAFQGIQRMTGQTLNFLPVRLRLEPEVEFLVWLERLRQKQIELIPYEHLPVQHLRDWLQLPQDKLLFESILYFQNLGGPVNDGSMGLFYAKTAYPLRLDIFPRLAELGTQIYASYHLKYFDPATVFRIMDDFERTLHSITVDPLQKMRELIHIGPSLEETHLQVG